jgi:D-beta-D-heptose 7-phosphate kinase/D-beta-D-heptose 1-phosphate adenosyltransferase
MTSPSSLLDRFNGARIAVIGDVMLDHFLIGRADRISPEAPVPVVRLEREECRLGGAANVAANIASLSGRPTLTGVIGSDQTGQQLRATLRAAAIDDQWLVEDATRPTTEKLRTVTGRHQQVGRVDRESTAAVEGAALTALQHHIDALSSCGAIVLSDYAKGVATPAVLKAAVAAARRSACPLLVDPKVPHAAYYSGATVITPNHHEAEVMTGRRIVTLDDARDAARMIHEACGASVLMTWGEHGMWVMDTATASVEEAAIPATAREVADVTGAGDTVIATLALSLSAGATLAEAARLATLAASIAVGRFGPAAVSTSDVRALLAH